MVKEDGMGFPGIGTPEDDEVCLFRLTIGAGAAARPEYRRQTDDAGGVSRTVATVDVVALKDGPGKLLG
jgi:hypothetical protein